MPTSLNWLKNVYIIIFSYWQLLIYYYEYVLKLNIKNNYNSTIINITLTSARCRSNICIMHSTRRDAYVIELAKSVKKIFFVILAFVYLSLKISFEIKHSKYT